MEAKQDTFTVRTNHELTQSDIADIVITAFEGGINYWSGGCKPVKRDEKGQWVDISDREYEALKIDGCGAYANPEFWVNDSRGYMMWDAGEEAWIPKVLTASAIVKAFNYQPPKNKYATPNWFRKVCDRVFREQYDASDADVLVQVAVFNELVYG